MNILYIIGNGLDIAHHMKTSYQDFFKFYLDLPSSHEVIQSMKKDIDKEQYTTWADLEIGLGKYSAKCKSKEEFLKCLLDMKNSLKTHLNTESSKIKMYRVTSFDDFVSPRNFLDPEPRELFDSFASRRSNGAAISIVTLNYTTTLESLLQTNNRLLPAPKIGTILHIHGTLDRMMVMGVNDTSQILNSAFNTDQDLAEEFVKPEYNDACMNNKNKVCESLIQKADVIVLYGTSLGPSDDKWWKYIGQRLSSSTFPMLIYLPYDENKNQSAEPNHLRSWTRGYIHEIHEKFGISITEDVLATRMCVAINKQLFPLTKTVATK